MVIKLLFIFRIGEKTFRRKALFPFYSKEFLQRHDCISLYQYPILHGPFFAFIISEFKLKHDDWHNDITRDGKFFCSLWVVLMNRYLLQISKSTWHKVKWKWSASDTETWSWSCTKVKRFHLLTTAVRQIDQPSEMKIFFLVFLSVKQRKCKKRNARKAGKPNARIKSWNLFYCSSERMVMMSFCCVLAVHRTNGFRLSKWTFFLPLSQTNISN